MKLTRWQFFCMMTALEVCMTIWLTIAPALKTAKQDGWISILLGGCIGIVVALMMAAISRLYPGHTLVQFTELIFGKWIGKFVTLLYFLTWYSVAAVILRDAADFLQLVLFRSTPMYTIIIVILLLMLYINYRGGVNALGRFSEIAGPLLLFVIALSIILNLKSMEPHLIRPILSDTGMSAILQGSFVYASFLGETYFIFMLMPFLAAKKQAGRDLVLVIVTTTITVTLATLLVIMLFGPNFPSKFMYPYFFAVRYISLLNFIENIDIWVMFVWLLAVFVKLSLYMFICSYGTAQWLGIKNWKKIVWWFAGIMFLSSVLPRNITIINQIYAEKFWTPYVFPVMMIGLPVIMLIVGSLRQNRRNGDSAREQAG
ncbi:GerAB/ArcD/ProY family transporter [Paenibacillus lignilyticus]|uniref:Endospore germination permease n=1 Tax=Paenibacillus lignilyticus TaxID=1172615 RepID=A0ABS5CKZ9_9BACL|nr:endospore germination permease [Paenibacillus lignilyticus]MBP3966505.1 endospore germination permease [Paenibacillus lignilyticus]